MNRLPPDAESVFDRMRVPLSFQFACGSIVRSVRGPQMAAQTHVQGNRNAHYDQGTDTQDQKPPDHPHNALG